jgi:hypothetical protein
VAIDEADAPPQERWFRWAIAFVWLATAISVLHPAYRVIGSEYLGRLGLPVWLMPLACAGELVLGLRIAFGPARTWLTAIQILGIAFFTLILAGVEPLLLAHPYGVLSKNLPMLALIGVAWLLEREGWTQRTERLLRAGMAVIWITEGLFPKILFQQELELVVVRESGLVPFDPGLFLAILGAAQILSGIAVFVIAGRIRTWILGCQFGALFVLPLLVSWQDPTLWVHPFGPMTKNVPILVGTWALLQRARTTPSST